MYPVSEKFLRTISQNARRFYWTGTITTKAGQTYIFENKDIVKGSGYITRSCCGSNEIELGSVYAAELGISLFLDVDRYSLDDAEITLSFHLVYPDGTEEEVPMGIFEITEANRAVKTLEIKAYDFMIRLDKPISFDGSSGTPYNFIHAICEECGVQMGQTKEEIDSLPNGTVTSNIYVDNDIESYRDLLFYVVQMTGCIAQFDRLGRLILIPYGNTASIEMPWTQRFKSSYSDFVTRYTAVSSTNQRTGKAEYYALETDDALTMNLGINPLMQFNTEAARERIVRNILNAIAAVEYVPCEVSTIGNPALDPMDCIRFSGGHADSSKISCITSITYKINGKHDLKCVGKNPKLAAAKSKNSKNISALITQVDEKKTVVYDFTNTTPYEIGESEIVIVDIDYVSTENTSAMFLAEVLLNVSAQEVQRTMTVLIGGEETEVTIQEKTHPTITVIYKMNDSIVATFQPKQVLHEGSNMLTLFMPISSIIADSANHFEVLVSIADGTAQIGEEQIKATLSGQGMAAGIADWNGRLSVTDDVVPFNIILPIVPSVTVAENADSVSLSFKTPYDITLTDIASDIMVNLPNVPMATLITPTDSVSVEEVHYTTIICPLYSDRYTFDRTYIDMSEDSFKLKRRFEYNGEQATIDRGLLTTLELPFPDFEEITHVEVKK